MQSRGRARWDIPRQTSPLASPEAITRRKQLALQKKAQEMAGGPRREKLVRRRKR